MDTSLSAEVGEIDRLLPLAFAAAGKIVTAHIRVDTSDYISAMRASHIPQGQPLRFDGRAVQLCLNLWR